ncbi:hypothetical protein WME76_00500 [Sorangium sp. So ce119]|uniref:hypothetical protein n=1 Tax=Sorangium sp. So ce119 TaxID=3133279 RepID=UPI003F644B74
MNRHHSSTPIRALLAGRAGAIPLFAAVGAGIVAMTGACGSATVDPDEGAGGGAGGPGATTTTSTSASTTVTTSVSVGGCYDAFSGGCGIPDDPATRDEGALPAEAGCATCAIQTSCAAEDQACTDDADCDALRRCVVACGASSCIAECTAEHPEGADTYRALLACGYCNCDLTGVCSDEKAAAAPPIACP